MKTYKGYLLAAVFALLAMSTAPARLYAQTPAPAAQWKFDEGSGAAATDASGNGNDGILQGDAGWANGLVGPHALSLSGTGGGFVDVPKPVVDTSQSYTVMAWVKVNQIKGFQTFVSLDGDQISGFFLQLRADTGRFGFAVLPSDNAANNQPALASEQDDPDPGVWYHLAGVYDAAAQTVSLYVNGLLQETVPFKSPWRVGGHTIIGRGKFGGNPVDLVGGMIDDVRFYQSALPAAAILAIAKPYIPAAIPSQPIALTINAGQITAHVSPTLYGLMTEEINHSYDGGLYAELIQNRAFKDNAQAPVHWSLVQDGGGTGDIALDRSEPLNRALPTSLRISVTGATGAARVGVANDGYWGIPATPNTPYRASFYARAADGFTGPLTVDMESSDGSTIYARASIPRIGPAWKQYTVRLRTARHAPAETGRFVISAATPGTVWLNLVSLFPPTYHKRPNGNRIDLMRKMGDMHPTFLRMPGGNYLEGNTIAERFAWKNTIGPVEGRPGHPGPWGYRSSDGMGLLEFLEWCEDLHIQPVLAVFAGFALNGEHVVAGPQLTPFVQDALDEIEYVTGDTSTHWGAERARDGHPEPFPLHYVEIGNEDFFDRFGSYDGRYAQFYDAIKAKYPKLQLIATAGVKSRTPDLIDDHFYRNARDMEGDSHHYDGFSRTGPKIFVGEWATTEGTPTPTMNAALGDAAWMTGMERNSDVVVISSYAPLLVNVNKGASQWGTNLIGYDALNSYGSPSYYAQQMFAQYHGDVILGTSLTGTRRLYFDATRDSRRGTITLKVVNPADTAKSVHIVLNGVRNVSRDGTAVVLSSAQPGDTNTLTDPVKIVPVASKVNGLGQAFDYSFAPYSVTILQMGAR